MGDAPTTEALQEASDGFFLAAEYGRSDVIKALADHGRGQIDLAAIVDPATGRSPLHVAVANGKTDALRVLLAAGFPPDVESHEDRTNQEKLSAPKRRKRSAYALAQELQAADLVMVFHQFLIQQVAANNVEGVQQMLAAGVNVAVTDGASISSLLHWAVSCQAVDVLADLLRRSDVQEQALVNRRNCDGATPLHLAAHSNQVDCVRLLLRAGADVAIRGEKAFSAGKTAAELTTSPEVLRLFRQRLSPEKSGSNGDEASVDGDGSRNNDTPGASDDSNTGAKANGHSRARTTAINSDKNDTEQTNGGTPREKHDEIACEHAAQVSKLLLQLEEKDLLINQLKKTIEDLVVEAQEIQKLGEERVMLEYVRKLREEKIVVERQLDDANDYIGVQQEQITDLKAQIRRMCDEQQAPSVANGHTRDEAQSSSSAAQSNEHASAQSSGRNQQSQEEDDTPTTTDPSAQSLKLDAWTPRSQREPSADATGGEPWRAVWNGLWQGKESAAAAHEEDGEVIMTV